MPHYGYRRNLEMFPYCEGFCTLHLAPRVLVLGSVLAVTLLVLIPSSSTEDCQGDFK